MARPAWPRSGWSPDAVAALTAEQRRTASGSRQHDVEAGGIGVESNDEIGLRVTAGQA
jgi:hypothetical protein